MLLLNARRHVAALLDPTGDPGAVARGQRCSPIKPRRGGLQDGAQPDILQVPLGCRVVDQLSGDQDMWNVHAALRPSVRLAKARDGGCFVPTPLDQNIQHIPVLIDSPPVVVVNVGVSC